MLQAYVDASGKGDPDLLIVAGYIATADVWGKFSEQWQEKLDHAHMPYFKMSEIGQSPAEIEKAGWFYRTIEEYNVAAISCTVHVRELAKSVREIAWPKRGLH
jgi:hypothetical protein